MKSKKQILVVEDNELNREILREILSGEYDVLEAENGKAALDILKEHKGDISLILLDVMMPVMDGYTFLDKMKEKEELSLIPVIVTTQGDSEADEVAALSHGATDFVPKPYRPQVILHRVASLIKLRETAAMVNQFTYDRLTGLYSKEFFYRKVREQLDMNPDKEYTITCSNLENFKLYNDSFGREAGDRLLVKSAAFLMDRAGEEAICGRYSADRFLCFQERSRARQVYAYFCEHNDLENVDKVDNLSLKWGVYDIMDLSLSVEQMCDRALLAADSIKGQYNQHIAAYDDTLRDKMLREKKITDSMETGLKERQFFVYLQPKYNLSEGCMAGAEALVRWIHPELGFISPGEFIPLFEKNGFIPHLDQFVWEQVCIWLKEWKEKGYPLLPVSVNVSRADVYQTNLVEILSEMTGKYGIAPEYLHLEITESAYAENLVQIIRTVDQLRKLGFLIEMDDFGSGYSSLNMFNQIKMDFLKLDMKFIQNEMTKPMDQSILNYIIGMAHGLGLRVVAEGVETKEQMKRLRKIGCDYVQGYYFAKPMPVTEYEDLLKNQCLVCDRTEEEKALHRGNFVPGLLIVDEDDRYREVVRTAFEGQFTVLEATDSKSGLACIKKYGRDMISIVILSLSLPEEGAAFFLKAFRQKMMLWQVPVLATISGEGKVEEMPLALETDDYLCKSHPLWDLHKRVERLMGMAAAYKYEITLQDETNRDKMTGLLNRRGLEIAMNSLWKEDLPVAVYYFDLDEVKYVNDTCGQNAGDWMIQSFADLLRRQTRAKDILCRYGGDEFIVILKQLNDREAAVKKATDICHAFHSSCSVGIALYGAEEKNITRLIHCAAQALSRAKQENKGGYCLWNDGIHT